MSDIKSKPDGDVWDDIPNFDSLEQEIGIALDACPNGHVEGYDDRK